MNDSMEERFDNPFSATRAADFTDKQIYDYWVDLTSGSGFWEMINPKLELPMIILGSKGSGKTHVMRYLSFPLQRLRHADSSGIDGIRNEGYVGIYMRCDGLNSARFRGKRQSDEMWADVFAYYIELWLGQMVVDACYEALKGTQVIVEQGGSIAAAVKDLFDTPAETFPDSVEDLGDHLRTLHKDLDAAINNCAINGNLDIRIRTSSGKLVFGVPQVFAAHIPQLRDTAFVYLIDEFENLTEQQQKLINTLIREKRNPSSFKIGARLYGLRTQSTFCADEEIKEGSEYERLPLDVRLRNREGQYRAFARRLVIKRLTERRMLSNPPESDDEMKQFLESAFGKAKGEIVAKEETQSVALKYANHERPYFAALRQALERGRKGNVAPGISSRADLDMVIKNLSCHEFPLLEKLNCFILYQDWNSKRNLLESSIAIQQDCQSYVSTRDAGTQYHSKLLHWKADLLAQLRRECKQKQQYVGFDTFVELSWGNPRHLLILLKHVLSWAVFKGEKPFGGKPISVGAQIEGVKEAADWFFRDARIPGKDGKFVQDAINRLGTLFRSIRYSDKPSECSLSTFSFEPASATDETRRLIDLAEMWSLLVYVGGQSDRNSERVDMKFQINRMLAPRWGISSSRRGALVISGDDLNAVFDPAFKHEFEDRLKIRVDRMTAPFFAASSTRHRKRNENQDVLPGMDND